LRDVGIINNVTKYSSVIIKHLTFFSCAVGAQIRFKRSFTSTNRHGQLQVIVQLYQVVLNLLVVESIKAIRYCKILVKPIEEDNAIVFRKEPLHVMRSEERRVGKECRNWWGSDQ